MSAARRAGAAALLGVLVVLALFVAGVDHASAMKSVTVANPASLVANAVTTYTVSGSLSSASDKLTAVYVTFAGNTDVSNVTLPSIKITEAGIAASYTLSGLVLDNVAHTVHFDVGGFPAYGNSVAVAVNIPNIVNPSQPGSYVTSGTLVGSAATASGSHTAAIVANATAVVTGVPVLTNYATGVNAGYNVTITPGPFGRISGTTAVGPNKIGITFPAGTTVPSAPPVGNVTVNGVVATYTTSAVARHATITVPSNVTVAGNQACGIVIAPAFGIVNPTAGAKSLSTSTTAETAVSTSGAYTIASTPALTLSVDSASMDFGTVDPGVTSAPRTVTVTVTSTAPYTLSRALTGSWAQMGLSVTGDANGSMPAGTASYTDSLTVTLPWTADPAGPLSGGVVYTALQ